jgi:hypothetical protein
LPHRWGNSCLTHESRRIFREVEQTRNWILVHQQTKTEVSKKRNERNWVNQRIIDKWVNKIRLTQKLLGVVLKMSWDLLNRSFRTVNEVTQKFPYLMFNYR